MNIKIGCHALIQKEGKFLLGIRNKSTSGSFGQYFTVGGTLEEGETLEQCLRREVKEETGLEIQNIQFFKYYERINCQKEESSCSHALVFAFTADYLKGEPKDQKTDCLDPEFFSVAEIKDFYTQGKLGKFPIDFFTDLGIL